MKRKLLFCVLIFMLSFMIIVRVNLVNKEFKHEVIPYVLNEDIVYNELILNVSDVSIFENKDFFREYNISENYSDNEIDEYGDGSSYITYVIDIKNSSAKPCYLDFNHFVIEVGSWFSWTSRELFKEINPQLENNMRICIYPGIETQIKLPFLLYYGEYCDNFMFQHLLDGEIFLNLGVYPKRYVLKTEFKNFRICN